MTTDAMLHSRHRMLPGDADRGKMLNMKMGQEQDAMKRVRFVYWQEGDTWLGYLEEYPDYWTQGKTFEELKENLKDIYEDLIGGHIPGARRVAELEVP